jgi:hypothetical protein
MTKELIENATLEAIYWWDRDENYYHKYFSNLPKIYEDKLLLEFFTVKIFEVFLKGYSIRRNLSAGPKSVDKFIDELFQNQFVQNVKAGNIEIIDGLSQEIKQKGNSTNRQTKSLLSKIAFLINPHKFSLYDNLAKQSLWEIQKKDKSYRRYELENYSVFIKQINKLIEQSDQELKMSKTILNSYKATVSYNFFTKHPKTFDRRIIDKFLWLRKQSQNSKARKVNNRAYSKFLTIKNET